MRPTLEVIAGVLLLAAAAGAVIVVWGLARGGFDKVPMVGIVMLLAGGILVATRLPEAMRGVRRMSGWARARRD